MGEEDVKESPSRLVGWDLQSHIGLPKCFDRIEINWDLRFRANRLQWMIWDIWYDPERNMPSNPLHPIAPFSLYISVSLRPAAISSMINLTFPI